MEPIYLDYAATTPVDPRVAEAMAGHLTLDGDFANPSSGAHVFGRRAHAAVEEARGQVAEAIGADPAEIVFTSGATEADNLAIKGCAGFQQALGRHIVTAATEHKAVLDACGALEFSGFEVTRLAPGSDGRIDPESVRAALRDDTVLVSLMHANNETGVVNDIAAIGALVREHGAKFHVDAAQTAGKLPLDLRELDVDLLALSAHKIHGPKGIGALYVRRRPRVRLIPQIHGGGQERGLRAGTLPTHQIVGLGEALAIAAAEREQDYAHAAALCERLEGRLAAAGDLQGHGDGAERLPQIRNVSFEGVEGEALAASLGDRVAMATGAACSTGSIEPSHVLRAMGQTPEQAAQAVRLSWGRFSTAEEIDAAAALLVETVQRLRGTASEAAAS